MRTKKFGLIAVWIAALVLWLLGCQSAQCFYSASTGRWLSRDPIEEKGGLNLLAFGHNDAVNRFDNLGRKCCLLTWNTRIGADTGWGHSALKCDNGTYVSAYPTKTGVGGEVITSPVNWHQLADDASLGPPDSTVCSDCIDEKAVASWYAGLQNPPPDYNGVYPNCADYALEAINAGLDPKKQKEPKCPCSASGVYWTVEDLTLKRDNDPLPTTPTQASKKLQDLEHNDCSRFKCVPHFYRTSPF